MGFAERWEEGEKGPGILRRLRTSVRPPAPLKTQIEQANRQVRVLLSELDNTIQRIRQRDSTVFKAVVSNLAKHDSQRAAIYANELTEIRKVGKIVTSAQLALEQISLRLGTITDMGEIANTLAPAVSVMRSVKEGLAVAMPDADREIGELSGLLSSVLIDASSSGGLSLDFEAANDDARRVLDEAAAVAEQRMKESFPEIPAGALSYPDREEGLSE